MAMPAMFFQKLGLVRKDIVIGDHVDDILVHVEKYGLWISEDNPHP